MNRKIISTLLLASAYLATGAYAHDELDMHHHGGSKNPTSISSDNAYGTDKTYSSAGFIDLKNAFFKPFGTNGRTCASCHAPAEGWTITPKGIKERFEKTAGLDPLFRLVDGANSPKADVSTQAKRRKAYSMLLNKGNIRVGIGIPADAEFELVKADDPYGFASTAELSLFRRPMPTTNLRFISAVMWDGRETTLDNNSGDCVVGTNICISPTWLDLSTQANHATLGHAEAAAELTQAQRDEIAAFEMGLYTAQASDDTAGDLTGQGAQGGSKKLTKQDYYFGINDTLAGDYATREPFNPVVMSLYDSWNRYSSKPKNLKESARGAIARGQALFNGKLIKIKGVKGLNDELGINVINGTCSTCHNAPNAGNHSTPMQLDIGISDAARRTPDMPLYTLRNKTSGEVIRTTDPGKALITGQWKDIGRFKGPVLRALASRPPYFHDGSAKDIPATVDFYNKRFSIGLTPNEKADLIAFLSAL